MRIFVTGGAGYIGSHTVLQLLAEGHEVCVFDNFANSSPIALDRIRQLSNRSFAQVTGDIRDDEALTAALAAFKAEAVIHFAGLKAVGESNLKPLQYYDNNVTGTQKLLSAMNDAGVSKIVFSSSATVYGEPEYLPFDEDHRIAPTNPYGRTKAMAESILADWTTAVPEASAIVLRYFNPVGAHESGRIGEDPRDIPNNLMPYIAQVAVGRLPELSIFGEDYPTRDGTGERDYVHVIDLAAAHIAAVRYADDCRGFVPLNIGTGRGVTVHELVDAYARASGRAIPTVVVDRRPGDVAISYAATDRARDLLGWEAKLDIDAMCATSWLWQSQNPVGYADE